MELMKSKEETKTMIDENNLLNEKIPLYHRAMMSDHYSNEFIFGKLIGRLKENYKNFHKSEILYITYRKEMFNYLVTVSHFDERKIVLTPIEYNTFKDWEQMKDYVRSIQVFIDGNSYQMERKPTEHSDVFDYRITDSV